MFMPDICSHSKLGRSQDELIHIENGGVASGWHIWLRLNSPCLLEICILGPSIHQNNPWHHPNCWTRCMTWILLKLKGNNNERKQFQCSSSYLHHHCHNHQNYRVPEDERILLKTRMATVWGVYFSVRRARKKDSGIKRFLRSIISSSLLKTVTKFHTYSTKVGKVMKAAEWCALTCLYSILISISC